MSVLFDPVPLPDGLSIPAAEWQQPPASVRQHFLARLKRGEALEARFNQHSSNSRRPPSTDASSTKRQRRRPASERRKPGGHYGHPGHPQGRFEPPATVSLCPQRCACGQPRLAELTLSHPHPVIERPVIRPDVTHWLLYQGHCLSCGTLCTAPVPAAQGSGDGPRLTGFVGEMAGIVGASRSAGQALCASVFGIPLSQGAMQKLVARVSAAILPHSMAMGAVARASLGNDLDEPSGLLHGDRQGRWGMANPAGASLQLHPHRSKTAFVQRIDDWTGILVSEGYCI